MDRNQRSLLPPQRNSAVSAPPARVEFRPGCWIDSRLALWLERERLLVLADLHWGYAASHRARGNLLPWWGDEEIEACIDSLMRDYSPAEMLWLGDVVHAAEGSTQVEAYLGRAAVPVTILAGNHDRRWRVARERSLHRGDFFFHHGDRALAVPAGCVETIGHHHPAACWSDGAGGRIKLPALIVSARRLVLPAFSPWAAGAPWREAAEAQEQIWALAPARIFQLPRRKPEGAIAV